MDIPNNNLRRILHHTAVLSAEAHRLLENHSFYLTYIERPRPSMSDTRAPSHFDSTTVTPTHLQVFSYSSLASTPSLQTFTLFSFLPPELQDHIWRIVLERHQRVIKLRLRHRLLTDGLLKRQGHTRPESRENERYGAIVDGYQTLSKLFHVCRQSRDVALSFYRVHLPCWLVRGNTKDDTMKPGILYFNPEMDFLHISHDHFLDGDYYLIVDLLSDFKTIHDPRNVGLLNLAIDHHCLVSLCNMDPASLTPTQKSSFAESLSQLRQVFFMHLQSAGRHVLGLYRGESPLGNHVNRAVPVLPMALNFRWLHPDPRPVGPNLNKVYIEYNPRGTADPWQLLLSRYLGDRVQPKTEYRVLLACTPSSRGVFDCQSGQEWLQRENDMWAAETAGDERSNRLLQEDLICTAFGFWLFPLDSFTPGNRPPGFIEPRFMNLTHTWPDLALVELT
ncbi:hypothetical protein F5Y03DRAFT_378830 [Xylaria venustula]|nr:hypothetical protein F5Y03DRAFT_378830 [Xylaria venustula]